MKEAASLMVMAIAAAVLTLTAAFYAVHGKAESDPEITRSAFISE